MSTAKKSLNVYHTSWATYGRNFQVADLAEQIKAGVTDVSYAFFNVKQQGNGWVIVSGDEWSDFQQPLPGSKNLTYIAPPDNWEDSDKKRAGNFGQLRKLKESGVNFNLHLSLFGWTWSKNASLVMRTAESREIFANSIIDFFKAYPVFNGIDFDWEYVSTDGVNHGNEGNAVHPSDGANFRDFLVLLRSKMQANGFGNHLIGMCLVAAPEKAKFNIEEIHPLVDEMRIMTYDFAGSWDRKTSHQTNPRRSKYGNYSAEQAADFYLSKGVPSSKILIGVACYSRGWSGTEGIGQPASGNSPDFQFVDEMGVVPYHMLPRPGAVEMWDDEAKAGYSYDSSRKVLNTYDTVDSVLEKCKIVHEKKLKGIIVWESAGDTKPSNPRSLVSAMSRGLHGSTPPTTQPPVVTPPPTITPPTQPPSTTTPPPVVTPPTTGIEWVPNKAYLTNDLVSYQGKLYSCIQPHTSLVGWEPTSTKDILWKLVGDVPPLPPPTTQPPTTQPPTTQPPTTQPPTTTPPSTVQPPSPFDPNEFFRKLSIKLCYEDKEYVYKC
jgi:chitinase